MATGGESCHARVTATGYVASVEVSESRRRGFLAGAVAGTAAMAVMYLANLLTGLSPLPQLLQQPLLAVMPGPVFGFLIDNLKHAGKVVEELGLLLTLIAALGLLGVAHAWASTVWRTGHLALAAGAVAWSVVNLVLLPISGIGLLGLFEGIQTPILWALIFAIYTVVLEVAVKSDQKPGAEFDGDRRRLVLGLPVAIGAISVAVLGLRLVPRWYQSVTAAPESGLTGASPALTPLKNFYVVSKNFADPVVAEQGWVLKIRGLAGTPYQLSAQELRALAPVTQYVTLECISNVVGGNQISTGQFTGVRLRDVISRATPAAAAAAVVFHARDGYTESLPLAQVMDSPEILVAHALNGEPLPTQHGFPARILIPGHYGMKGPKWLDSIELATKEVNGYWENQGWDPNVLVKTMSRIDTPAAGDTVRLGAAQVAGIAFAGKRGVAAVEVSTDRGSSWRPAELQPTLGPLTWTLWTYAWTPPAEGSYALQVRARDGEGHLQSAQESSSYPSGSTGYHTVRISVGR